MTSATLLLRSPEIEKDQADQILVSIELHPQISSPSLSLLPQTVSKFARVYTVPRNFCSHEAIFVPLRRQTQNKKTNKKNKKKQQKTQQQKQHGYLHHVKPGSSRSTI